MNVPGERFDLGDILLSGAIGGLAEDSPSDNYKDAVPPPSSIGLGFVGDIKENEITEPPKPPSVLPRPTGFPEHRKRVPKGPSRFKQRMQEQMRQQMQQQMAPPPPGQWSNEPPARIELGEEKRAISEENERRIAAMSEEDIERERKELMERLDPRIVQAILKRGAAQQPNSMKEEKEKPIPVEGDRRPTVEGELVETKVQITTTAPPPAQSSRLPSSHAKSTSSPPLQEEEQEEPFDPDNAAPPIYDPSLFPPPRSFHFPRNPAASSESLDPSDPNFFTTLHEKYFPELPADPSKLAWMSPVSEGDAYSPSASTISASAIRFDFKGSLVPPRKAHELPVFLGLHHHADAPAAAGYTIPELARLARSTFPSQRCIAIQILGRVLFKLGTGVYKNKEIEEGLWKCVKDGGVIETLEESANAKGGHVSVRAHAQDAVWLWQKGGGKRPQKTVHAQ